MFIFQCTFISTLKLVYLLPYYKFEKMVVRSKLIEITKYTNILDGAVAQLARAPALQAGGQEFDSPQLHQKKIEIFICNISFFLNSTLKNI